MSRVNAAAEGRPAGGRPASFAHLAILSCMFLGFATAEMTSNFLMPDTIHRFTENAFLISLILSLNPLFGFIAQPWAGYYSDRIWTPIGRRKPILIVSSLLLILSCLTIAFAANIWILILIIVVYQFTVDVNSILQRVLIADTVPPAQRARAFGMGEIAARLVNIGVLFWGGKIAARGEHYWYFLVALIVAVAYVPMMLIVKEPETAAADHMGFHPLRYFKELAGIPYFMLLCAVIGFGFIGHQLITNYYRLFTLQNLKLERDVALSLWALQPIVSCIAAFPIGWLADRAPKKRIVIAGMVLVGMAGYVGTQAQSLNDLRLMAVLVGIGYLCIEIPLWALAISFMPAGKFGQFSGFTNVFRGLPRFMMFPIFGALIEHYNRNYRLAFYGSMIVCLIGILLISFIPGDQEKQNAAADAARPKGAD